MKKTNKQKHKTSRFSLKKIIIIYLLYLLLFVTIFAFLDYYDYYVINIFWLSIASVFLAIIPTYIHFRNGKRTEIDDIADEL